MDTAQQVRSGALALVAAALVLLAAPAAAQREPHLGYVFPAGGQCGMSFHVTVGGQNFAGVRGAWVSGAGVQAELTQYVRPLTQRELNDLREKAAELQRRRDQAATSRPASQPWTEEDARMLAEIRTRLAERMRRDATPALAETAQLRITIAPGAECGPRDLRLMTPAGLTNPLVFCVGELPECSETQTRAPASVRPAVQPRAPGRQREPETLLAMPMVANGQILPGEVDGFRFRARKGQRLVASVSARALLPYLADAVPGWFQAIVRLRDGRGNELACVDDGNFDPDPVLRYEIPADAEYMLEVHDALHRGREDFVYRLTVGEMPVVTSMFPLGARAGTPALVALRGWNLPVQELQLGATDAGPVQVQAGGARSSPRPFARDPFAECLEQEANDTLASAQRLDLGSLVNGRIDRPGDVDWFRCEGQAGQVLIAAVSARRLMSPVDSVLRLTDAQGRKLTVADDLQDPAEGLSTHHADARLRAVLPHTGTYYLQLREAQGHGGEEYAYRLRVGPPHADFALRVVPSCLNLRAGGTVAFTVHAVREDGFAGEITLALRDAPAGFRLDGARIPPGQDQVRLTLSAEGQAGAEPLRLVLEGRARAEGREIVRQAVAADDLMQAFVYRHLVPAQELLACVAAPAGPAFAARIATGAPVAIPAGGSARVLVQVPRAAGRARGRDATANQVAFELDEAPAGVSLLSFTVVPEGFQLVFGADPKAVKTGTAGNLIVRVVSAGAPPARPGAPAAGQGGRRRAQGLLPAIPFAIRPATGGSDARD